MVDTAVGSTATSAPGTRLPRVFWALWVCQLVNRLGGFVEPFLVLYLTHGRHLAVATAGLVVAANGAGSVVSQLLGGWLTDHVGRRRTMLIGFAGTGLGLVVLGQARGLVAIAACAFVVGVAADLFRPAVSATVADLLAPGNRVRAYGLLFWAVNIGFSVSAVSAGVVAQLGFGLLFWINAATCLVAATVIFLAVPETRPERTGHARRGLLGVAGRDLPLLALVAISTVNATVYFQAYSTLPLAMTRSGLAVSTYGLVIALNGAVIVVLQPLLIKVLSRYDRSVVVALAMLLVGLGFGLGAVAGRSPGGAAFGYAASVVVWTLGEIGVSSVLTAVFADLAPADLRGGYMGVGGFSYSAGAVLGPMLGTAVFGHFGPVVLWTGCAALGVLVCGAQLALRPALRRRSADVTPPAGS
jgi:MFS family permease